LRAGSRRPYDPASCRAEYVDHSRDQRRFGTDYG
jgi:hypothetical protein